MFYISIRANLISKTVESSKLMMSHVIVLAYDDLQGKNLPVEPCGGVPYGALFDGRHDDLGNRDDNDNGDDGAHGDAHADAAHAPHEILLGFSYLSPLFNASLYIMLD